MCALQVLLLLLFSDKPMANSTETVIGFDYENTPLTFGPYQSISLKGLRD